MNQLLYFYGRTGQLDQVKALTEEGCNPDYALEGLAEGGYIDLIDQFITPEANLAYVMRGACRGAHTDIIDKMIKLGNEDWDFGLVGAVEGGFRHIAEKMLKLGARSRFILGAACRSGRRDFAEWGLLGNTNYNASLESACEGGHIEMVNWMIELGATDYNKGLYGACVGGHVDLINLMLTLGATNYNWGLEGSIKGSHVHIAEWMMSLGAYITISYTYMANNNHDVKMALFLIQHGADINKFDVPLSNKDVIWLYGEGVTKLGQYQSVIDQYKRDIQATTGEMLLNVLGDIIAEY